ncbi:MAG: molecular chaperone HtpG [Oscillospiraceae bacterium]|nr:molecular chaperone HtpG [Oscillospiraceae bacterium]
MAKKQFKAESRRLLDLMINSIYTHKEIFLREIISNASDAIDKLCYVALTDDKVGMSRGDFAITITADKDARTLTVSDNGIGMDREELENNLGVIASSGSYKFRREAEEKDAKEADIDIIGQFGVGFYSAFMVADEITVLTKKYGSAQAYSWQSSGADGYTITECNKDSAGTDVIMHIKEDTEDEKYSEYLDGYRLYSLVKKYSDYIRYPIRMMIPVQKVKEGSDPEKPEYEMVEEMTTVNSMVPLWQRKRSEVTDEEYAKFYSGLTREFDKPQRIITVSAEGSVTYKALLFIPSQRPLNFNTEDYQKGLQLYSAGVMIMDKCDALLPDYLRFVRGVVDSPDLSLNISRELLQHDRQLRVIAQNLEKKIRADLEKFLKDDREGYEKFYANYGRQIGYGIVGEGGEARKDALKDLLMFYSSTQKKLTTLREYLERMKPEQKCIYYAAGESVAAVDRLPQTELLKEKDYEVLYLTGEADEFVLQALAKYEEKPFRSIVDGDLELDAEEEKLIDEKEDLMKFVKETLGDRIKEAKASRRLKTHPVCLTAGEGFSFEMEKYFKNFQMPTPVKADRILELNVKHPAVMAMETALLTDRPRAELYAKILYNQALLIAGLPLDDPGEYTDMVAQLMK